MIYNAKELRKQIEAFSKNFYNLDYNKQSHIKHLQREWYDLEKELTRMIMINSSARNIERRYCSYPPEISE